MSSRPNYDVEAVATDVLFGTGSISYEIPRFQRAYSWSREQIDELLADIVSDLDLTLEEGDDSPYFLGSIVLARSDNGDRLLVLDGQQRLTTVSLILATISARLKSLGDEKFGDITKHLVVGKAGKEKRPIMTLQEDDQTLYQQLLDSPIAPVQKVVQKTKLAKAALRVQEELDRLVGVAVHQGATERNAYWRLAHRVLYGVTFVRIITPSEAAAFELFETLNDRGLELSAADLVKNKLLARSSQSHFKKVVDIWDDVVQTVGPQEIVNFLRFYWIAHREFVRKAKLYRAYNDVLKNLTSQQVLELAGELRESARAYRHINDPDPEDATWPEHWPNQLAKTFAHLNDFKARSCRPLLLATANDAEALEFAASFAETITLRHSVIGDGNANTLERGYAVACAKMRDGQGVKLALSEALGDTVPTDEAFIQDIEGARMGRVNDAWRRILLELNAHISSGETKVLGPKKVHVEHILPQAHSDVHKDVSKAEHEELVGALGNLTLLHAAKNAQASNKSYSAKREFYLASEIQLTRRVANRAAWGPKDIRERTRELAKDMVKIWPMPNFGD